MTTAELYEAPSAPAATPPTFNPWIAFLLTQPLLGGVHLVVPKPHPPDRMSAETRARLLRELGELSIEPGSLDRDSEIDIWGHHNGT